MIQLEDFQMTKLIMKMYDNSAEAIFFFDKSGKILTMNNAAKKIVNTNVLDKMAKGDEHAICMSCKGYTNEQELQTCLSCYLVNPEDDFSSFQVYLDTVGKGVLPYAASYQTIDEEAGIRVFMFRDLTNQYKTQEKLNQKT